MSEKGKPAASRSSVEQALFDEELRFVHNEVGKPTVTVSEDASIADVLGRMREAGAGGVLVTGSSRSAELVGIFTQRDYLDKIAGQNVGLEQTVATYMTPTPKTLAPGNTVGDAIQLMTGGGYRHVPVLNDDKSILGLISVRDIVNFIADHFPEEVYNHPPRLNQRIETQEGG